MVYIYCIKDINSLKYVGSTKQSLLIRLSGHKADKKRNKIMSSSKLDLENCEIKELEICDENNRKVREQYWIDKIDCVNRYRTIHNSYTYFKEYRNKNKDKINKYRKDLYNYKNTWGGLDCNLLKINMNIFK